MNKFDDTHQFRLACIDDLDLIMQFYKSEWSETHILANNNELFEYEFKNEDRLNFMLAVSKESKEIDAICGFIQNSIDINSDRDLWGCMFKARSSCNIPFIGIETQIRLIEYLKPRTFLGNGVNHKTAIPLLKRFLKNSAGKLNHFYKLSDRSQYKIATIKNKLLQPYGQDSIKELVTYDKAEELFQAFNPEHYKDNIPYKDEWFITRRYYNHPKYKYQVMGLGKEKTNVVIVAREINLLSTKIFRIVDVIGNYDEFKYIGKALDDIMEKEQYEYIDFYEHGMNKDNIVNAGFIHKIENDVNIIPNFFEPFVCQNIDIWYSTSNDKTMVFKADADQDRPNIM